MCIRDRSPPSFIGWGQTPIPGRFFQSSYAKMHMPSAFPILFGIIHVPFDSFISQNEGNAEIAHLHSAKLVDWAHHPADQEQADAQLVEVPQICVQAFTIRAAIL